MKRLPRKLQLSPCCEQVDKHPITQKGDYDFPPLEKGGRGDFCQVQGIVSQKLAPFLYGYPNLYYDGGCAKQIAEYATLKSQALSPALSNHSE
ncbi:MAG: hypothetical protein JKY15_08430 [Deltaproteobacteria bacterium]|nr:hypothetical protein [Deltaproteobacteria bacterium]